MLLLWKVQNMNYIINNKSCIERCGFCFNTTKASSPVLSPWTRFRVYMWDAEMNSAWQLGEVRHDRSNGCSVTVRVNVTQQRRQVPQHKQSSTVTLNSFQGLYAGCWNKSSMTAPWGSTWQVRQVLQHKQPATVTLNSFQGLYVRCWNKFSMTVHI